MRSRPFWEAALSECTCGPVWVYEPGCGTPHRDDSLCAWCEDADERERLQALADDQPDREDVAA